MSFTMDFLISLAPYVVDLGLLVAFCVLFRKVGNRPELDVKAQAEIAIAREIASRSFNLANNAMLGVASLQKTLAVPRILTKEQVELNAVAKEEVDQLFRVGGTMDWMKPLMSEDELDAYEKAQALAEAEKTNNKQAMDKSN